MQQQDDEASKQVQESLERLRAVFHHDCYVDKKPEGCHQYAEYLRVIQKEPGKAADLFRTTCQEMGLAESCIALGNMYLTGKSVEKNVSAALELYSSSCRKGSMGACNNAGLVWQNGYDDHPRDYAKAEEYFRQSCEGDFKNGCFNLSILFLQGHSSRGKDMQKALEYSLRSCELGHSWGCANASRILKLGDGVDPDPVRANELKQRAKKLARQ